jgi:hypothetical protein
MTFLDSHLQEEVSNQARADFNDHLGCGAMLQARAGSNQKNGANHGRPDLPIHSFASRIGQEKTGCEGRVRQSPESAYSERSRPAWAVAMKKLGQRALCLARMANPALTGVHAGECEICRAAAEEKKITAAARAASTFPTEDIPDPSTWGPGYPKPWKSRQAHPAVNRACPSVKLRLQERLLSMKMVNKSLISRDQVFLG